MHLQNPFSGVTPHKYLISKKKKNWQSCVKVIEAAKTSSSSFTAQKKENDPLKSFILRDNHLTSQATRLQIHVRITMRMICRAQDDLPKAVIKARWQKNIALKLFK